MNITIIGAGNMGGAIARGILGTHCDDIALTVANPSRPKLEALAKDFPSVKITTDNIDAVTGAEVLVLAVKPWILPTVAEQLGAVPLPRVIVSIVAGTDTAKLIELFGENKSVFYVIPDTAIMVRQGMTFIASAGATPEEVQMVESIFATMGETAVIEERLMSAATALSSCGIAYAYKYIQACVQAGVQLGFRPAEAQRYAVATVKGAMAMLDQPGATPQTEIDRVTTPGGMTIRGVNTLEHTGFTASVIESILAPLQNK